MRFFIQAISVFLVLLTTQASALADSEWTGRVIDVVDGDTVVLRRVGQPIRVRLYGVDAPEKKQDFGVEAKDFVEALALGERVLVKPDSYDRYGRTVAVVILPDGRDLSRELVRAGLAWWYRKYAPKDKYLAALEAQAKAAGRGLWGDVGAVAPWRHRRR